MRSYQKTERVYLTRSYVVPDPDGGGPTTYHGGHQFEVPPSLAAELIAGGYALPVVDGEPVQPAPPVVEPEPEPVVEQAEEV